MQIASIPVKFPIPFANSAGGPYIRTIPAASQIGTNPGFASLTDGFVPLNMQPVASGGIPPFGQDMNGILKQATAWLQWAQAGGAIQYDASFQSLISGYPQGAVVASATALGLFWQSIVDNNVTNPDSGGDNWITYGDGARNDIKFRPTNESLSGWLKLVGTTIGSVSSGASQLAAAVALGAYTWTWTNFSNTQCPVIGGRGGSALADFNANKPITVLDMRGYGIIGMDIGGTTRLNGVPATSGNSTTAGSLLGENLHPLITGELAAHGHGITDPSHSHTMAAVVNISTGSSFVQGAVPGAGAGTNTSSSTTGIVVNNAGSGTAHNNVQNSIIGTFYLKL